MRRYGVQNPFKQLPAILCACLLPTLIVFSGCAKPAEFELNAVHKLTLETELLDGEPFPEKHVQQLGNTLTALFGTADQPHVPTALAELVDLDRVQRAAGPVGSDADGNTVGLYRQHCAHCHGITGGGNGSTASSLNPYPRDFRMGRFKFKSTKLYKPPTDSDLRRILKRGIAGTSMPSFDLLPKDDIDALVDYVKYLSVRGQVERALLQEMTDLDAEDDLMATKSAVDEEEYSFQIELLLETVEDVISPWTKTKDYVIPVTGKPRDFSIRIRLSLLGQELFFGKANCVQCHGETGVGDGQTENYDDWTNEWLKRANLDPYNPDELQPFLDLGALPPRKIRPRNLRYRVLRGGSRPEDLFRRIKGGIEGTSMPSSISLTEFEVWCLVSYVLELPYTEYVDESGEQ